MSAAPVIIIITKPTKPARASDNLTDSNQTEIQLIGHENSTDYEILLAAAAQLENADK